MPFARSFFVKKVSVMSTVSKSAKKLKPSLSVSTAFSMGDYDSIFTTVSLLLYQLATPTTYGAGSDVVSLARSGCLIEVFRGVNTIG